MLATGLLALGVILATCGGSSTPAATPGPTTTTTGLMAYVSCMRSHGVANFPDPGGTGGIPKTALIKAEDGLSESRVQAAENACRRLLPPGGSLSGKATRPITTKQRQDYLRAAACMRAHGISNFPDPVFEGGQVEFPNLHQLNSHAPKFIAAQQICQKLIPPGLPYSGSGG